MKKTMNILLAFSLLTIAAAAQTRGSGNVITKKYDFAAFDKVNVAGFNGSVQIKLGTTFSITVEADDNLINWIVVEKKEDVLKISQQAPPDSWIMGGTFKVTITMPEISKLANSSNGDVSVDGFTGRYLGIDNNGNGDITLKGTKVDLLEVTANGNGDVNTKEISSGEVTIKKNGNGNINIRTEGRFKVEMNGNGDIVNYGKGRADIIQQSGNGDIVYRNTP
jgi:hypothetical protein